MKTSMLLILLCLLVSTTSPLFAQKIIPYNFFHARESSTVSSLEVLTEVNGSSSTFLRLYFKGTELGDESYLILEANDGAKQKLRKTDLENWSYSSAYFNGSAVKVSLFSGAGEKNKVSINAIKINDRKPEILKQNNIQGKAIRNDQAASTSSSAIDYELLPYAAAVGRFTDGTNAHGTGWIAPNGAIVTSHDVVHDVRYSDKDIIEFNVPPSDSYGNVNHPGPEDQYPVKYKNETYAFFGFDFKRKHRYENEGYNGWVATWGILEALPNSTGLRPGERQQQNFRIAPNLGSFTLKETNVWVDIFHYGETDEDLQDDGTNYRTLKRHVTKLLPQAEYIASGDIDIESYMVYNLDEGDPTHSDSDTGAPITYNQYNIAMGVHTAFFNSAPAVGVGFKHADLLNPLNDYFSSDVIYVDQGSLWDSSTGSIDKPYFEIWDGIEHAEINGMVSITKGTYNEPMYITKAVTLVAPVGHVVIGENGTATARQATLPREIFMKGETDDLSSTTEDPGDGFDLNSFPNPFVSSTEINYLLNEPAMVQVNVYDKTGNKIRNLLAETQSSGNHSVVWDGYQQNGKIAAPGLYVIRIETAKNTRAVKLIKN
ncbi:MAG TPA: FlgD immunoglobulin-like domain containing protein [Chryseolinea sp.]